MDNASFIVPKERSIKYKYSAWCYFVRCEKCQYFRRTGQNHDGLNSDLFHTFGFSAVCPKCGSILYDGNRRPTSGTGRVYVGRFRKYRRYDFCLLSYKTWFCGYIYDLELKIKKD